MSSHHPVPRNDKRLIIAGIGFLTVSTQIILLREMMVFFYGNELSTGIVLMIWLLWTALGSYMGTISAGRFSRFTDLIQRPVLLPGFLAILGGLAPLTVILVRISKTLLGISQGEIIGIGITSSIITTLSPFPGMCPTKAPLSPWPFASFLLKTQ